MTRTNIQLGIMFVCVLALTYASGTAWKKWQQRSQLGIAQLVDHPFMGANVLLDDQGSVLDATDKAAIGRDLDPELLTLVRRSIKLQQCVPENLYGYRVSICPLDPSHANAAADSRISIDIDDARAVDGEVMRRLASGRGVKSVTVPPHGVPQVHFKDGQTVAATRYAPLTDEQMQTLRAARGCKVKAAVCHL
jgi:hypothetical protein